MKIKNKEDLARQAVEYYLKTGEYLKVDNPPEAWKKPAACFVTIYLNGQLRGCIGSVEAYQPLAKDIINNAVSAAFSDWRFGPVTQDELPNLEYEVSVLSPLKKVKILSLVKLKKDKPGVVLENSGHRAIYLPQVWEQLPAPESFLESLCQKAGLSTDAWYEPTTNFWTFTISH